MSTKLPTATIVSVALSLGTVLAQTSAPKGLALSALPQPVQKTVQETLQGGEIKSISREKEDGVTQYEIESMLNGKHRDFNVDTAGKLVLVEEETSIDSVPAPAKAAIMKRVADGKLATVETVTKYGQPMMYEASWKAKSGKSHEVLVKSDGSETKD